MPCVKVCAVTKCRLDMIMILTSGNVLLLPVSTVNWVTERYCNLEIDKWLVGIPLKSLLLPAIVSPTSKESCDSV